MKWWHWLVLVAVAVAAAVALSDVYTQEVESVAPIGDGRYEVTHRGWTGWPHREVSP